MINFQKFCIGDIICCGTKNTEGERCETKAERGYMVDNL